MSRIAPAGLTDALMALEDPMESSTPKNERDDLARAAEALDDAMARGDTAQIDKLFADYPELATRFQRDRNCVALLQQLRPGSVAAQSTRDPDDETNVEHVSSRPKVSARLSERFGRFDIVRKLGQGGFGIVLLANDRELNRQIALKVPRFETLLPEELRRRFQREARAGAGLEHPNIAAVYEAGEIAEISYIASAYCPGPTLAEWLEENDPVAPKSAAGLIAVLADAVEHAHGRGVLHRDLKPSNVMLVKADAPSPAGGELSSVSGDLCSLNGQWFAPKLTDFGLAKNLSDERDAGLTKTHAVFGTPSYMAPEQAGYSGPTTPALDVYGLGTILYEVLTGKPPFVGDSPLEIIEAIKREDPLPPRNHRRDIPKDLETICLKCLEKEPLKRYPSAQALRDELDRFLAGRQIHARPIGAGQRAWRWCRRRPLVASLLASLAAMAITAFLVVVSLWQIAESNRVEAVKHLADADENLAQSRQVVNEYLLRVTDNLRLRGEDLRPLRRELLELVVPYYESVVARYQDSDEVLREQAEAYLQLSRISLELGELDRAETMCQAAVIALETLCAAEPEDAELRYLLCSALHHRGGLFQRRGKNDEATEAYQQVVGPLESLIESFPQEKKYRRLLASTHHNWGTQSLHAFHFNEATAHLENAIVLLGDLVNDYPDDDPLKVALSIAHNNVGMVFVNRNQPQLAESKFLECLALVGPLFVADPSNQTFANRYATIMMNLADVYSTLDQLQEAERHYQVALEVIDDLVAGQPSAALYRQKQLNIRAGYGDFLYRTDQLDNAERVLNQSLQLGRDYLAQHQPLPRVRLRIAHSENSLARLYAKTDRALLAEELYVNLVGELRDLLREEPRIAHNHVAYNVVVTELAELRSSEDRQEEAVELLASEIAHLEEFAAELSDVSSFEYTLAHFRDLLAKLEN